MIMIGRWTFLVELPTWQKYLVSITTLTRTDDGRSVATGSLPACGSGTAFGQVTSMLKTHNSSISAQETNSSTASEVSIVTNFKTGFGESQCCSIIGHRRDGCHFTPYVNEYDRELHYTVPSGQFIRGIRSTNAEWARDRIFSYEICQFIQ
ncbi:uncharacterized protein LOC117315954 [Pecten maximus]|uniref:uncharacterized protein LOC117315954 n=1 Tax=Pecten maximus TaxID=6579 RepID=UPI001458630C|nr:uncharacterized protein LOC117315954 [Pecten maximus]